MKQAILVRQDLKMPKGKLAAQVAHASLEAALKTHAKKRNAWLKEGGKKVILKVKSLKELLSYQKQAEKLKLKTALIKDAGLTFFKKPTITCLAIGPDRDEKIDKITSKLKLL